MKKTAWLAAAFAALVLAYVVFSSFRTQPFRCRVCITFKGNRDCRTASGETRQQAERTAVTTVCAQLAGGVTESNQCENTAPDSVEWLRGN